MPPPGGGSTSCMGQEPPETPKSGRRQPLEPLAALESRRPPPGYVARHHTPPGPGPTVCGVTRLGAAGGAAGVEAENAAVRAALEEFRRLVAGEAELRLQAVQRLERDVERLRAEHLAAAAGAGDDQRAAMRRLERLVAASAQELRGHRLRGDGEVVGEAEGRLAALHERQGILDERQGVLDDRLRALRLELRELVAQEAEQRAEGQRRIERAAEQLRAREGEPCGLRQEMLSLSRREAELRSLGESAAFARDQALEQRLAELEGRVATALEDSQLGRRFEDLAVDAIGSRLAHAQEAASRAAMGALRADVAEVAAQWEERFEALRGFVAGARRSCADSEGRARAERRLREESDELLGGMISAADSVRRAVSPLRAESGCADNTPRAGTISSRLFEAPGSGADTPAATEWRRLFRPEPLHSWGGPPGGHW